MARDDRSFENKDNFGTFDDFMVDYDEEENNVDKDNTENYVKDYNDSEQDLRDETSRMLESQISMDFDSPRPKEEQINFDTASYDGADKDEEAVEPKKVESNDDFKNKMIKYTIWFVIGFIIFIILMSILGSFNSNKSSKKKTEKEITLASGEKYSFANIVGDYQWESSENDVATVTKTGEIEALRNGDTTITITTDKEIITYKVHVKGLDDSVTVTKVTLESNTIELSVNESYEMKVNIYPKNATSVDLSWFSSDDEVAIVDDNGKVTAVGNGTCTITVRSSNGNSDVCLVKVTNGKNGSGVVGEIKEIIFDTSSLVLKAGINYTVNYSISPSDAKGDIEWISSNEKIATVKDGVITTISEGTISIVGKNGNVQQNLTLTVVKGDKNTPDVISDGKTVPVSSISLNQSDISLYYGSNYTLSVVFDPTNATNKNIVWTSSNSNVVSVNENGYITAVGLGEATIIATASSNATASCHVVVINNNNNNNNNNNTVEETISLNVNNTQMNVGEEVQLVETVTPNSLVSKVTWKSSNTGVAKVSSSGLVTGVGSGTATITASLPSGKKAECVVNVSQKVINAIMVTLSSSRLDMIVGGTSQLTATVLPKTTTNKNIAWSSSDTKVAVVDNNGKITAKGSGIATITARTVNGIKAHCTVVVKKNERNAVSGVTSLLGLLTDSERIEVLSSTVSESLKVGDKEYKIFKQRNFRDYLFWYDGNIADNGAAPMALSIILSGYMDVNPISVANYMGYSSYDRIAETADYYGLNVKRIIYYNSLYNDSEKIEEISKIAKDHLKSELPIIAYVTGSNKNNCVKYKYSGSNHYIALLGLNSKDELIVGNPGLLDGSGTIEELLDCYMSGKDMALVLLVPDK